jgi:hypothetical protein
MLFFCVFGIELYKRTRTTSGSGLPKSYRPQVRGDSTTGCGVYSQQRADEVRYSILPVLIGDGIQFFEKLDRDITLYLAEVKAYESGMVELRYKVRGHRGESPAT